MKASDILFGDLTTDEIRSLPDGWGAVYLSRPKSKDAELNMAMRFRLALLIGLTAYAAATQHLSTLNGFLLFLLYAYELAYYSLCKDKALLDWTVAQEDYTTQVMALPDSDA